MLKTMKRRVEENAGKSGPVVPAVTIRKDCERLVERYERTKR